MSKSYKAIAEYYDPENAAKRDLERDVPFFLRQAPKRRQSILEIAVGTARAAIPLAQSGHRVVGIDYDRDMLAIARRKRDAVGLGERELSLVHGNALRLDLKQTFDWVCIFFNTFLNFTTLEQQDRLLQVIRRHLKPRGRLYIDMFNPDFQMLAHTPAKGLDPMVFYVPAYDRTVHMTAEVRRGAGDQVQRVIFRYTWFDASGIVHRERTEFDLTYIFPRELRLLMERNGFRIEEIWGGYDGSALKTSSSRIISRSCRA